MPGKKVSTDIVSNDAALEAAKYLSLKEIAGLAALSKSEYGFFQPILDEAKAAHPLLTCVVQGNLEHLAKLVKENPELLFKKGQVKLNKEYGLALMSQNTIVKPNRLYFKILPDSSLQYTVILTPAEAPIIATIAPEDLEKMGIGTLSNPLDEQDIETHIKPKWGSLLEITTSRGHTPPELTYYDVSPYQLMTFLCDEDMKESIMPLVMAMTQEMQRMRQVQYAKINSGGADLVKIDRDPRIIPFKELTRFITSYRINNQLTEVTFSLLENPDGIIYYKDADTDTEYLFYVTQETQTVELIESIIIHSEHEHQLLDSLYASFRAMEQNSARRSSNDEHQVVANTMQHRLQRKGIQYKQGGTYYCDNRADFNQHFNACRKCIRLYQELKYEEADKAWRELVGQAQRKVIWLLQRICEKQRPFSPELSDFKGTPFLREFNIWNGLTTDSERVFSEGHLVSELGSDFAIIKSLWSSAAGTEGDFNEGASHSVGTDLVALLRLVESAKANVKLSREPSAASYHRGPS